MKRDMINRSMQHFRDVKVEVHLVDFSGDLYGQTLAVDLVDRVRDVKKFASREELVDQIRNDVAAVRTLLRRG